jgi:hypothetical protein
MNAPIITKPFSGILESGITELIGINEKVDQNDYSGSVDVDVSPGPQNASGVIQQFSFYQTEDSGGAILSPAGTLYILDADPDVESGATSLDAAEWVTVIGTVDVAATDWKADAKGSIATITDNLIYFHGVASLYFTFKLTSATSVNSAAGDDEQLEFNFWYQLYS